MIPGPFIISTVPIYFNCTLEGKNIIKIGFPKLGMTNVHRYSFFRVHYPGTTTTESALKTNKALWSSEDYSTFNDNVGAGCLARVSTMIISI